MTGNNKYLEGIVMLGKERKSPSRKALPLILLCATGLGILVQSGCSGGDKAFSSNRVLNEAPAVRTGGRDTDMSPALAGGYGAGGQSLAPQNLLSAAKPEVDPARTERLVVYNAVMNVVVERISDSLNKIKTVAENMGGYMQEMSAGSIALKIPAQKFNEAIAEVEKLGEVTRKEVKGTDVTEEMRDLDIRLRNAEEVRQKLLKLLERAEQVDDALRVEKELERITEQIELLKGRIAYLRNKVAFCTLTIVFNSPIPQEDVTSATPFRWVHELGDGMTRAFPKNPLESSSLFRQSMFALPKDYIKFYEDREQMKAMSAAGVMLEMHKWKNYEGGSVSFWGDLVRRVLVEEKAFHIRERPDAQLDDKAGCALFQATRQIGSKQYGYLLALGADKKNVYVLEAWGPVEQFEKDRPKIENAVTSMRLH